MDVDASADLAGQFGVMAVPTMVLFKNGKQVDAFSGYMPAANIISKIKDLMSYVAENRIKRKANYRRPINEYIFKRFSLFSWS